MLPEILILIMAGLECRYTILKELRWVLLLVKLQ